MVKMASGLSLSRVVSSLSKNVELFTKAKEEDTDPKYF